MLFAGKASSHADGGVYEVSIWYQSLIASPVPESFSSGNCEWLLQSLLAWVFMANTGSASNLSSQITDDIVSSFGSGSGEHVFATNPAWFSSFTFPLQVTAGIDTSNTSYVSSISEDIPQPAPAVDLDPVGVCLSQQQCESTDASQAQ
ncbi:hypothetical protein V6N11_065304 [Hibiscus sabdariffa]|uniref:Uncharacterized protein n=2 Tax=Hibiscus sabdariffa TaxID=183260 RepID=A0ABR2QGI7_9ROSI